MGVKELLQNHKISVQLTEFPQCNSNLGPSAPEPDAYNVFKGQTTPSVKILKKILFDGEKPNDEDERSNDVRELVALWFHYG
jgi:hypothetical protein